MAEYVQIPDSNNKCAHYREGRIIEAVPCPASLTTEIPKPTPSTVLVTVTAQNTEAVVVATTGLPSVAPDPKQTTSSVTQKNGVSGGAVAGIAIGMLIAGVLLAGAVFFLLLRRQKRKQATAYQTHYVPPNGYASSQEKGPTITAGAVASNIDDLLPQPVADDTITNEVSQIRDKIKNHVRTYYHSAPISTAGLNEAGLRDLATAAGVSTSVIISALANPNTRPNALRLIVGWVILSRSTSERSTNLLPADVAGLALSLSGGNGSSTAQSTLYSKWKTITGALLQQRFGKDVQDPNRIQTFANTVAELDSLLAPFVQGSVDGGQRRKNLDMILTRSASFAFLLFSQPGSFRFDFANAHSGLIVFPALVQTFGDQGQVLNPSRVLVEKEIGE
ncbi:hypothetical protein BKA66DRAFT_567338 [Pyrenochaeta sp. MPI-SDFR-AT-0127]|nr:hypothetical protein BKA66DRAFT_567338 [Pyrenochaeta sp. MPI-SDFR-AT-0127]